MGYSDWQLTRIRDALSAYYHYERAQKDDEYVFGWSFVREAIGQVTEIDIGSSKRAGAERLRQFVEGIKNPENPAERKYPVLKDEWLEAVVRFLTHPDSGILSSDELSEYRPDYQAALRLIEYLNAPQPPGSENIIPPSRLQGSFMSKNIEEKEFVVRELTLQNPAENGYVEVVLTEEFYAADASRDFDRWTRKEASEEQYAHYKYIGWAVLTPESHLLIFLKNERNQRNRNYITVGSDIDIPVPEPITMLVLLANDKSLFQYAYADAEGGLDKVAQQAESIITKRLQIFPRRNR